MIGGRKDTAKAKRGTTRLRIFIWAALLTAICGLISLPEPLEDIFRGGRNYLRQRPADQSVVVVAIDDQTINRFGDINYSRANDAALADRLVAMGARKVYFDRAFADKGNPHGDRLFADALERHRGKVFLGAYKYEDPITGKSDEVVPIPQLRPHTELRSLDAVAKPFLLSAEIIYASEYDGVKVPSISQDIAGTDEPVGKSYRPDFAIQFSTIPSVSLIDVLDGKVADSVIRGKHVIVGYSTVQGRDMFHVIGQGWYPGAYVHVAGAQTLKEGKPVNIGWFPAWLAAAAISALFLRIGRRTKTLGLLAAAIGFGLATPIILDSFFVTADFISAYLMFGIVAYRSSSIRSIDRARLENAGTLMPNLSALRTEPGAGSRPIVAMRIRNYAAVCASFAESVEDELITAIARRLTLPGEDTTFYQAEDVLYWLGPALEREELEGHLEGLARLIDGQFVIKDRKLDIHVAFGVDNEQSRSVASRIGRALLAADTGAGKHQLVTFSTIDDDEERAWELSLMSELDAAIDAGDIWLAYQPQFEISSGAMFGVEALVRWQHPVRGTISPEAFIGPAEEHNRMMRLTLEILDQATLACRQFVEARSDFRLSVNLSAALLEKRGLAEEISDILWRNGFAPENLTLEVTESAPFSENVTVSGNLSDFAALGIELSIDDYGTGNATLEYLRSVPCQEIKIDRRFVTGITGNTSDRLLVISTVELAHGLGRRVIAEGIEDAETLGQLRKVGCDIAQGYFLSKPLRLADLKDLIAKGPRQILAA